MASLYALYQIEKEISQDRLDLGGLAQRHLEKLGGLVQRHLEKLEQHLGQMLRVLEAQGPVGKKALEELKRSYPDKVALIETALRAMPLQ